MRRVVMALAATAGFIALLVGVKAQSAGAPRSALGVGAVTGTRPGGTRTSSPAAGPAATGSPRSGRFTGQAVDTPYGTVQVQAVVVGGKLTDVVVLQQTDGGRSSAIDAYALPILKSEALSAQSADVDVVSGATYTSGGYARSLQAALDAARG